VKGSEIFLGDLVRVVLALRLKITAIERAASFPGFAIPEPELVPHPISEPNRPPQPFMPPPPPPASSLDEQFAKTPTLLQPIRTDSVDASPPVWLDSVTPFPAETDADLSFKLPYEPLFAPRQARHILSAALATRLSEGEIDVERIVSARARREPVRVVPRRLVPSLRRGVQVLLDRREALMPFFADQNNLVGALEAVVGKDRLSVLQFLHRPTRVLSFGKEMEEHAYEPPALGTPILLVTDLGIGLTPLAQDMLSIDDWRDFAGRAARARCPVVALVPYSPERWPSALRGTINIVQWDRSTTAGEVHRSVGSGLQAPA
jgi:hypothetical protein